MTLQSVVRAHEDLSEGRISVSHGELLHANINRSPTAYLRNPEQERARSVYNTFTFYQNICAPQSPKRWHKVVSTDDTQHTL